MHSSPGEGPALWLYGVVRLPRPESSPDGLPFPVDCVPYRDIGGLVSSAPSAPPAEDDRRATRRRLTAHMDVLNRFVESETVLPAAFGTLCSRETLIRELLAPHYDSLLKRLEEFDSKVEVRLKASYDEGALLTELFAGDPQLAVPADGYHGRIAWGQQIAEAAASRREADAEQIMMQIERLADRIAPGPQSMAAVVNVSALIDRDRLRALDDLLAALDRQFNGAIRWNCLGPLPPYSFVTDLIGEPQPSEESVACA